MHGLPGLHDLQPDSVLHCAQDAHPSAQLSFPHDAHAHAVALERSPHDLPDLHDSQRDAVLHNPHEHAVEPEQGLSCLQGAERTGATFALTLDVFPRFSSAGHELAGVASQPMLATARISAIPDMDRFGLTLCVITIVSLLANRFLDARQTLRVTARSASGEAAPPVKEPVVIPIPFAGIHRESSRT